MQDILKHITRYKLPGTVSGTAAWFRERLADVLAVVEADTVPHLMLTLTCDEHSPTRWREFADLEDLLHKVNTELTWKDAPVEAARIFINRVNDFMKTYVLCDELPGCPPGTGGIFGKVYRHMIRYEVQGRHSLHAHIMLWLRNKDDRQTTGDDVCGCTPLIWDEERESWVVPSAYEASAAHGILSNHIQKKQQHYCTGIHEPGCRFKGTCK